MITSHIPTVSTHFNHFFQCNILRSYAGSCFLKKTLRTAHMAQTGYLSLGPIQSWKASLPSRTSRLGGTDGCALHVFQNYSLITYSTKVLRDTMTQTSKQVCHPCKCSNFFIQCLTQNPPTCHITGHILECLVLLNSYISYNLKF